jgi:hypothetical protein
LGCAGKAGCFVPFPFVDNVIEGVRGPIPSERLGDQQFTSGPLLYKEIVMTGSQSTNEWFDLLGKVLLRGTLFGLALVTLMFVAYLFGRDAIYRVHGEWFSLTKEQLDVIFYCFIGATKIATLLFFFFPWLAIRWVLSASAQ